MGAELRPLWAEIDLDALVSNYQVLAAMANPSRVCAVVKADAYGHGAIEVSRSLFEVGCRDFAVALVDEGIELREAGIDGEILVLSEPSVEAFEAAAKYAISVTLYSPAAIKIASSVNSVTEKARLGIQLKIDTGMYRAGASIEDLDEIVNCLQDTEIEALWSHFAVADELNSESIEFTLGQIGKFHAALRALEARGVSPKQLHIANTAGLINYPQARFTKARVGLGLYGYSPILGKPVHDLVPVLSLRSEVSFVKKVDVGERPSYGRYRPLERPSFVATVPVGYADGFPRALFLGGGQVLINGARYDLAGMVTMDQILIDLGPNSTVSPGDHVVLIGDDGNESIRADEWATCCSTVAWEILCGISRRVPRRYVHGRS